MTQRAPLDPQAHHQLAQALHRAGAAQDAVAASLRAVELAPHDENLLESAGTLLLDLNRASDAYPLLARASNVARGTREPALRSDVR